jgi:ABC-type lipoprotein release transport system permease subunit
LLARAAGSRLAGVDAADPVVYAAVAALQLFVAMAACLWPARRAGRADPMLSLRGD